LIKLFAVTLHEIAHFTQFVYFYVKYIQTLQSPPRFAKELLRVFAKTVWLC